MHMWFVYDDDKGFHLFTTETTATSYYAERLANYRHESADAGEWIPEVASLCCGKVTHVTELQEDDPVSDEGKPAVEPQQVHTAIAVTVGR